MSDMTDHAVFSRLRKQDEREYRLLFALGFLFFLAIALVTRLLPRRWRPFPPGPNGHRSIIGDAKAAADVSIPYAFMR